MNSYQPLLIHINKNILSAAILVILGCLVLAALFVSVHHRHKQERWENRPDPSLMDDFDNR